MIRCRGPAVDNSANFDASGDSHEASSGWCGCVDVVLRTGPAEKTDDLERGFTGAAAIDAQQGGVVCAGEYGGGGVDSGAGELDG